MPKKLTKVEFTFDDGSIQTLEGEIAESWLQSISSCIMMSTIHHAPMREYPWQIKESSNVKEHQG